MRCIAPIALAALIATPALAAKGRAEANAPDAVAATSQEAPAAKADPKICRRYENTASRMRAERLCLTREEWRKFDEQQ